MMGKFCQYILGQRGLKHYLCHAKKRSVPSSATVSTNSVAIIDRLINLFKNVKKPLTVYKESEIHILVINRTRAP